MLSKETIDALRKQAQRDGMAYQRKLIEHIDALQAQLDKLQDDYTAQGLALKAAKAMQQAETERADANEQDKRRIDYLAENGGDWDKWTLWTQGSRFAGGGTLRGAIDEAIKEAMKREIEQ